MNNYIDFVFENGVALLEYENTLPLVSALNAVRAVKERKNERRVIAVIGSGSLRDTINTLNITFGYNFMDADKLMYIRKNCRIQFTYSDEQGEASPESAIQVLYAAIEADNDDIVNMRIHLMCDALKNADAMLVFSTNGMSTRIDWDNENALIDFAFIVTNALSALSGVEKLFLSETASKLFGSERVALVLANANLLNATDYEAVTKYIDEYMKRIFNGEVSVFCDSDDALKEFYEKTVVPNTDNYYAVTTDKVARLGAEAIINSFNEFKKRLNVSEQDIHKAIEDINSRKVQFEEKADALCHMTDIFIEGNVKAPLLSEMRSYSERLEKTALEGVKNVVSKTILNERINNYFKSAWSHFFDEQMLAIREMFDAEAKNIEAQVKIDTEELFACYDRNISGLLKERLQQDVFRGTLTYGDGLDNPLKMSTVLLIASIPLAFVGLPLAVISAVSSVFTKKQERQTAQRDLEELEQKNVENVGDHYLKICSEEVDLRFNAAAASLKQEIRDAYKNLIDNIFDDLNALRKSDAERERQMGFAVSFENEILPKLNGQ